MSEALTSENIERTKRQLRNIEVQRRLGGVASELLGYADSLYIPSVSLDGHVIAKESGIPIVTMEAGTELQLSGDNLGFSEEQRQAMFRKGIGISEQDRMESTLSDRTFRIPDWMSGVVINRKGTYSTKAGEIKVSGRPVMVLNASSPRIQRPNTTPGHELVHIAQDQKKPFKPTSGYPLVQREAEAYSIQGQIEAGLTSGEPRATKANRIMHAYDEFRKSGRNLKEEADQLSFERQLRKDGIGILAKDVQLPDVHHGH